MDCMLGPTHRKDSTANDFGSLVIGVVRSTPKPLRIEAGRVLLSHSHYVQRTT